MILLLDKWIHWFRFHRHILEYNSVMKDFKFVRFKITAVIYHLNSMFYHKYVNFFLQTVPNVKYIVQKVCVFSEHITG